ncbi:SipW-cognate class signal peptide [Halogranum gelatinilyticum]|uniref:SipW-cognate class signal peptide n=1 Tax=Halogranum gelatinilyticum TaxID=660521 RepID=A0A1G9SMZ9_9EURY|nr:hypothetical protein [Halogranum gelatinilyticum]SDM36781.1 SipW-cognate class signal peptide [Halogranum gelatinilyticum]
MTQPQFRVSRRTILAGLGTIGVASAGAGLGTTAFFSDTESLDGWLQAGRVDLKVDYRTTYKPWLSATEIQERADEFFKNGSGRTIYPVEGDEMSLHVGSAPPVGTTGFEAVGDNAPSHEAWGAATRTANVCDDEGEDYIGDTLVDGDAGVFVDLMDIKPYDEGETTFSLHLCGNPSLVSMRVDGVETPENTRIEPEEGSGDDTPETDAGELQNYLWIEAWADDCDNLLNNEETPFYQGSLAGFVDLVGDDYQIPFDGNGGGIQDGDNGDHDDNDGNGGDADLPAGTFEDIAVNTNVTCEDINAMHGVNLMEVLKVDEDPELRGTGPSFDFISQINGVDYRVTITVVTTDGGQATSIDWEIEPVDPNDPDLGIETVILKDGSAEVEGADDDVFDGGVRVYYYEDATSGTGLTVPDDPDTNKLKGISNIRFCYDDDGNGDGNGGGGTQETPQCLQGVRCWAFRWYLPCKDDDATNLGFSDLPSDAAPADLDGDGELTLADELIAAGLVERDGSGQPVLDDDDNPIPLGVNVVQTDGVHFTLHFDAVQCRHNPDAMPMDDGQTPT